MKPCPFCAEQIQDQAIKCRFCGSMLDGGGASPGPAPEGDPGLPRAQASPPAPPPLAMIFVGVPSWKAWFLSYLMAAGLLVVALAVSWLGIFGVVSWTYLLPPIGALLLAGTIWLGVLHLTRRSSSYRISNRTLDTERGVLSRRIETLQLGRVQELDLRQTLLDRILGVSCIHLVTHEAGREAIDLRGLPANREIFEQLKDAVERARLQRGGGQAG